MNDFNIKNIKPILKLSTYEELRDQGLSESQAVKLVNKYKGLTLPIGIIPMASF